MSLLRMRLGYVPLTDAAPLIVAKELGFAAEEGLDFDLVRLQSWAQSRDLLGLGGIDAAHMLVPLPIAQALGLGPDYPRFDLLMVLSLGGQAIVVGNPLADELRALGHGFGLDDPLSARTALTTAAGRILSGRLRVGVPFPFSTQTELVRRWLEGTDLEAGVSIRTVPPPLMADALASGEVDAFCVGEPWASFAIERRAGSLLLAGRAIWAAPPEKGLVVTRGFAEDRPEETGRLMRAVWRSCRWLDGPDNRGTAAEILSRPEYLNLSPELTERGLIGRLHVSALGAVRHYPDFLRFHDGAANFPWRSIAALLARRIAVQHGLQIPDATSAAMACFRTDLYRRHLRLAGADLPAASARLEGSLPQATTVPAEGGQMILGADAFFDGETFDPDFVTR